MQKNRSFRRFILNKSANDFPGGCINSQGRGGWVYYLEHGERGV